MKYLAIIISLITFIYEPLAQYSQSKESRQQRADTGALAKTASESQQCHRDLKKKKKGTLERSLRMNYVADQAPTASFLGGIYSEGSDRSYLKAECYEFSPTDKKTKRSWCVSQPEAFISGMSWPQIWPQTTVISTGLSGRAATFFPFSPLPPLHLSDSTPPLSCYSLSRFLHPPA